MSGSDDEGVKIDFDKPSEPGRLVKRDYEETSSTSEQTEEKSKQDICSTINTSEEPSAKKARPDVLNRPTCPICDALAYNAMIGPCSHTLCEVCFLKLGTTSNVKCPECRNESKTPWIPNRMIRDILNHPSYAEELKQTAEEAAPVICKLKQDMILKRHRLEVVLNTLSDPELMLTCLNVVNSDGARYHWLDAVAKYEKQLPSIIVASCGDNFYVKPKPGIRWLQLHEQHYDYLFGFL